MNEERTFRVYESDWEKGVFKIDLSTIIEEDMHRVITTLKPGTYIVLTEEEFENLT